jgi:hypothetical protein
MATKKTKSPKVKAKPPAKLKQPSSTPQIMSGKPSEKSAEAKGKKAPKTPKTEPADKIDPEWETLVNLNKAAKPLPYSMADDYAPKSIINHKVLGLGFVMSKLNNRIEVLFKEGKKTLITNYKKS